VVKQLLRHGHIYREGNAWTKRHEAWLASQRLSDHLAQAALGHMLCHLAALDTQIAAIDEQLEQVATTDPWVDPVSWLCSFRGIATRTALGLLAEIGDFRRFASPRELMSYLGLTPSEYSSGQQQHRGHITKTGNRHARRLLIEAAWHYQHRPRQSARAPKLSPHVPPDVTARAWQAQVRLHHRHRTLTHNGKRSTVATTAVARELAGFIWAAMTNTPLRDAEEAAAA
jgi:transposase